MSMDYKTKSQASFEHVCSLLDFSQDNGLVTAEHGTEDTYLRHVLTDAIKKLRIDAIFFLKPEKGGPSIPLIYFKLMESPTSSEIAELHKLSWNIGQAPLLFIVLPDAVLVYNNLKPPRKGDDKAGLIEELKVFSQAEEKRRALKNYERAELETGNYWKRNVSIFKTDNGIFRMLLKNLDYMRRSLINKGLPSNIVHSILVRSIFIKYLEDRRDRQGNGVFPSGFFSQFLKGATCFTDLLEAKKATYAFFRCLSDRFNGDILVVDQEEEDTIRQDHLDLLRRMLKGEQHLDTRQMVLWPLYSFDVIPIELISSIYEQFLTLKAETMEVLPKGIHYTPYHLVAFLMDQVLPFADTNLDMRIIDPACGSGIFLVESYRRLVARWLKSNHYQNPNASELLRILKKNIFGVDLDEKAIRVAALSLYLTICDYLEPKTIWDEVKFERLVNSNLFAADFFDNIDKLTAEKFDLVVGNPPWESKLSRLAEKYVTSHSKHIGDRQICQVFLWKSADICKPDGKVCMIMSSKALLFNRSAPNSKFRKAFFSKYSIKAIFNFSALRHALFSHAAGPGAAIIFSPVSPPDGEEIRYYSPKPSFTLQDDLTFIIEPQDISSIPLSEALKSEVVWKIAMWGSPRDYELIKKLSSHPSLKEIAKKRNWVFSDGFIVGNQKCFTNELFGKPEVLPENVHKYIIDVGSLKCHDKCHYERWRSTKRQIYKGPHILIKQSPDSDGIVSALMIEDSVFSSRILGIHGDKENLSDLVTTCEAINSDVSLYFAMLTTSSWLVERDDLINEETMSIPIPKDAFNDKVNGVDLLDKLAKDEVFRKSENSRLMNLYGLDDSEKALVEDTIRFTLDYFRNKGKSEAIQIAEEKDVREYMETLCVILNTQFSPSVQRFFGTTYVTKGPLRMVSFKLVAESEEPGNIPCSEQKEEEEMGQVLKQLDQELIEKKEGSIYLRRHIWRYSKDSVHIIKPNQMRYWSISSAISDADRIYADIMSSWRNYC